jgi:hypothetical protein
MYAYRTDVDFRRETILYGFTVAPDGGYDPTLAILSKSGNFYGTTYLGPGESLAGSVFRLTPPKQNGGDWTASILYGFTGGSDGRFPATTIVFDTAGNLYGATQEGGGKGTCQGYCSTVFEVSP